MRWVSIVPLGCLVAMPVEVRERSRPAMLLEGWFIVGFLGLWVEEFPGDGVADGFSAFVVGGDGVG